MRLRPLLAAAAAVALLAAQPAAGAASHSSARCTDAFPLHAGSCGTRVAALQWLEGGHHPNVFNKVKPLFKHPPNGSYGARTKAATKAWKYRIGYPAKGQCPSTRTQSTVTDTAGRQLIAILEGHIQRPACWVAVAQQRIRLVEPGATKLALRVKAWELSQLGHTENPAGSNCGPQINAYFTLLHLPCGLEWCEIFQAAAFSHAGYLPVPFAQGATSPYGVISTEQWALVHGYLNAKAAVGSLAAFLDDGGHIGYVIKATASGYETVEGNEGDRVQEVWHPWNDRLRVFIDLPGLVAAT